MSLYFVCGKVGAGKSYRGMVSITDTLVTSDRLIVTNLPVNLAALSDFLQRRHPGKDVCLYDHWRALLPGESEKGREVKEVDGVKLVFEPSRIRVLQESELAEFYRFRHVLTEPVRRIEAGERGKRNPVCLDFSPWLKGGRYEGQGVVYHLDELQLFYNVRKFADAPEEFPFYLSQHRKLGDDIYVYTQQPQNVDKMFRSFTQEFIYIINIGKKRVGWFRMPGVFRFAAYPEPYTGQIGQVCQYSGYFRMDMDLAGCYNTAAGIGIEAVKADKAATVKGLPWQLIFLLPVFIFLTFWLFPKVANRAVAKALPKELVGSSVKPKQPAPEPKQVVTAAAPSMAGSPQPSPRALDAQSIMQPTISDDVFMAGYSREGGDLRVFLSDGRVLTAGRSPGLTKVTANYVIVDNVVYRMRTLDERLRAAEHEARSGAVAHDWQGPSSTRQR